jgi:hypothetical protein
MATSQSKAVMATAQEPWLKEIHQRLIERNAVEVGPHRPTYEAYNTLWRKSVHLESKRIAVKHALALLEHEISDMKSSEAVTHISKRILAVHEDLRKFNANSDNSDSAELDLSKTIYQQRKLISNQVEYVI